MTGLSSVCFATVPKVESGEWADVPKDELAIKELIMLFSNKECEKEVCRRITGTQAAQQDSAPRMPWQ